MSPCTVLVARELAATLPAICWLGLASGIRSTKLVSSRLKAIVCEFAMLPEIFSSANACARIPVTAVVRAPKIPITRLPLAIAGAGNAAGQRTGTPVAICEPEILSRYFKYLTEPPGPNAGQDAPPPGKNFRAKDSGVRPVQAGPAAAGAKVSATPFMQ